MGFISSFLIPKTSCDHLNVWITSANWVCEEIPCSSPPHCMFISQSGYTGITPDRFLWRLFSSYSLMQEWFLGHRYISIRVLETFQHSKGKIRTLLPPTSHIVCKYTLKMFSLYTAGRDWLKFRAPTQCSTSNTAMWDAPVEQRKPDPVSWAGDEDMETLLASHRQCHRALGRNSTCKIN